MESWGVEVIRRWGLRTGRWPLFTTTAPLSGNFLVKCHFLLYFHSFAFTRNLYHGLERFMALKKKKEKRKGDMVTQWIRSCLPVQGTQVGSLVWEDSTCHRATRPLHNYWACALEPMSYNSWSLGAQSPFSATRETTTKRSPCTSMKSSPR